MARNKYKELNIEYKLKDLPSMSESDASIAKQEILKGIIETRRK